MMNSNPPPQSHYGPHAGSNDNRVGNYSATAASGMMAWGVNQLWPSGGAQSGLPSTVAEYDQQQQLLRHNDHPDPNVLIKGGSGANNRGVKMSHREDQWRAPDGFNDDGASVNTAKRGLSVFRNWWGGGSPTKEAARGINDEAVLQRQPSSEVDSPMKRLAGERYVLPGEGIGVDEGLNAPLTRNQNSALHHHHPSDIYHKEHSGFGHDLSTQRKHLGDKVERALSGDNSSGAMLRPANSNAVVADNSGGRFSSLFGRLGLGINAVNCNAQRAAFDRCVEENGGDTSSCQSQWDSFVMCDERRRFPKSSI